MLRSCLPPIFCVWASSHNLSGSSICSNGISTDDLLDAESLWFCPVWGFGSVFLFALFVLLFVSSDSLFLLHMLSFCFKDTSKDVSI